jgi:hypothetical protein
MFFVFHAVRVLPCTIRPVVAGVPNANKNKLRDLSPGASYTDRATAKLVPSFADTGYCVVSTTYPYGRILGFLDRMCCQEL